VTAIAPGKKPEAAVPTYQVLGILAAATIACLVPWINKAFCIDDPLFLWAAAHIQSHPLDFYGFDVNWFSSVQPFYDVMKNPPLACYYLAGAAALVGWSEPALHAAYLLPTAGAIWGTWFVARAFCRHPVSAALLALATPAFLVSSSNVMCDTMMVCLWTWTVGLWVEGIRSGHGRSLCLASFLIAAAALTKYFAISLIPLLAVYTVLQRRRATWQLAWLLIPVALLAGYQLWTSQRYGRGLLSDAASFAWGIAAIPAAGQEFAKETVPSKLLVALSFTGGSFLPVLSCAPWIWRKKGLALAVVLALATTVCARHFFPQRLIDGLHVAGPFSWSTAAQLGFFTVCGALVLWLALSDLARNQSADACLLTLWVLGTFGFAGIVNWTCNVRSLLPIAPAFGILVVRQLEHKWGQANAPSGWRWALIPSAFVALLVTWADFRLANSARTAAVQVAEILKPEIGPLWFQGHWGFQYYMQAEGGRAVDLWHPDFLSGDIMIVPDNNTGIQFFPPGAAALLQELEFPVCPWLATMQGRLGAGFYSSIWGPMPFVFCSTPPEDYRIWRWKMRFRSQPQDFERTPDR
jgi:hypothetical protein